MFLLLKIKDLCLAWADIMLYANFVPIKEWSPSGQQQSCCQKHYLCSSVGPGQETSWSQQRWIELGAGTLESPLLGMKMSQQLHHTPAFCGWAGPLFPFLVCLKLMHYLPLVLISKTKAGSGPKFMEIKCCQVCLSPLGLFHNFIKVTSGCFVRK